MTKRMPSDARTCSNLVVINGLQPPWDEGGAFMTAEYVRRLEGKTFVLNRGPRTSALGDVSLTTLPMPRNRLLKVPSYAAFVAASLYYSIRLQPEACHFVPLCAPGPLRQLHGLALSWVSSEFCEVLFQVRRPTLLLKALSRFRVKVSSALDFDTLSAAGFDVEFLPPTPKERTSETYSRARLRKKYGFAEDEFIVSHVGHLTEGRGVNVIAEAARRCPEARFLLVLSSRESEFRIDLPSNVTTVRRYIDDIHEIYALSNVYLFPLRDSGSAVASPLSLLEAKSADIPILCTDFPNLRATLGNYARASYLPYGSVESMGDAVAALLKRLASDD